MNEDDAFCFIRARLKSVWALELLLFFHRHADREFLREDLIRELRGSPRVVHEGLENLRAAGLVAESPGQRFSFAPANPELGQLATDIAELYATRPVAVIKAISASPNEKLQIFSDAFKIRDK